MAQYTERLWTQTKDTEQLTFIAGVNLPYRELVKESGPNTNIMVVATTVDAIGYVLSPKGVLAGEKVDIQMLSGGTGAAPGGGVQSVTGLDTDNTDPLNPIVNIAVDGVTITGQGTPGDPLVAVGGGGGSVNSVTGLAPNVIVDNTDPINPIVAAGTESWEFSGILTTPVLSGAQNNYTQAGMADITTLRVIGDVFNPPNFSGIDGGTDGRILIIHNVGATSIFFLHNSPLSLAANRIMSPGQLVVPGNFWTLPINGMATFQYDLTSQRWRVIGNYVYEVIADLSGVINVTGNNEVKQVGFNGVFVDGVTITGNGTVTTPLVAAPASVVDIGNTLFVDVVYGNDGTAIPNSLVNKYATIDAAFAAANALDTIEVFAGDHVVTSTMPINSGTCHNFYFHQNTNIAPPAAGNVMFLVDPGEKLKVFGYANFIATDYLFRNSSPADNICDVEFECNSIEQDGSGGPYFCDITSIRGSFSAYQASSMGIFCDGWCNFVVEIDRHFLGRNSGFYNIGNIVSNGGLGFNDAQGVSRFQLRGRTGEFASISGSSEDPEIGTGIFSSGIGGSRNDRLVKICADVYASNWRAFLINEGTWVWKGSGYSSTEGDVPFFDFSLDNIDFYFEHREGSVTSDSETSLILMSNNGTSKFCGNYKIQSDGFPLAVYNQSSVGSRIIFSGNYQNIRSGGIIILNDQAAGTPFFPMFDQATIYAVDNTSPCIGNTSGSFTNFFVIHSLVTNTNYDNTILGDTSVGNRHYVDAAFTNDVTSESFRTL